MFSTVLFKYVNDHCNVTASFGWLSYWCFLKRWGTSLFSSRLGGVTAFLEDSAQSSLQGSHQGFTGGEQRITVVLLSVPTAVGLALFAVDGHYWIVPAYVAWWCPDPLQLNVDGCSSLCVADSSWVSAASSVVHWVSSSFFRPSLSLGHFSFLILTCEILVVLLPAGIFMCGSEWGICWPDSLTQMHECEWVPSSLFAIRDLNV